MKLELAFVRVVQCLRDIARKMGVGGRRHDAIGAVDDRHDPLQRVFRLFLRLVVSDQMQYLVAMRLQERAFQRHEPGGKLVVDAMACWTPLLVRRRGRGTPDPAAVLKHCAAIGAARRFRQLAPCFVAVVHQFLQQLLPADWLEFPALAFHD
jgi:hypothetical protein